MAPTMLDGQQVTHNGAGTGILPGGHEEVAEEEDAGARDHPKDGGGSHINLTIAHRCNSRREILRMIGNRQP
ncbi:MAG: hypothetical protein ACR2IF_16835 [Terriglobales bacterium]